MERGSGKSGGWRCPNSPEDLELPEEGVRDPAQLVDSEAEEEDEMELLREELVQVEPSSSSSTFSIEDIAKEKEVPLGEDPLQSVAESLDEVDVASHPNKNPFSPTTDVTCPDGIQHSGDLDSSSPQPSSSKGALLKRSLPLNPVDHSDEMMRQENNGDAPVEPEPKAGGKTRLVDIPKAEKFKGPSWDSEKDVDNFCKAFNGAYNKIAKKSEDEKKAKEAARIEKKENRRNALAAMLMEQGDRKRTRLATGAIARKVYTSQGRKRKRSQAETSRETENELSPVPTLTRPLSPQPGPSVVRAPLPPPTPEPETSQCAEEGLSSGGEEKDTNFLP